MVSNKFTLGIIFRIGLLFGNLVLISYVLGLETRMFTLIILFGILVIQVYELIYYVNKTNRELASFLDSIKDKDLITRSQTKKDFTFSKLNQTFNNVIESIQQASIERESQYNLLNLVVQQAQTGILLIDDNRRIEIINPTAREILGLTKRKVTPENIEEANPPFYNQLLHDSSPQNTIIEIQKNGEPETVISCIKNPLKLLNKEYILITFQDIGKEMERKEIESWQKLIRTLSHEIMNSVTPISSLTETSLNILEKDEGNIQDNKQSQKLKKALQAIEKRSSGLYDFVNDVRKVIKIPEPTREETAVKPFIEHILLLMENQLSEGKVKPEYEVNPPDLAIIADQNQVEQVLINLMLNAIEALKDRINPHLKIEARREKEYNLIKIRDNGEGIDEEALKKIFIPFYSTKEQGSGIGLSLCRQIMQKHGGKLTVESEKGKGSCFTLWFPVNISR